MRPGPARGTAVTETYVVSEDMAAIVDGKQIHAVYGTCALVADVERICRAVLEPHLEPGEEGVGARLEILHRAPVAVGETVELTATVASVAAAALMCEVVVRHGGSIVARGSFEQRLVRLDQFREETAARQVGSPAS